MCHGRVGVGVRISIFGLGYVGTVTMACLARDGHQVTGVDVNADKVAALAEGRSTIVEPKLDALLAAAAECGRMRATTDVQAAIDASEMSLISVGTPSTADGEPELDFVERVCRDIGAALRAKGGSHTVVVRSTVPPGTTDDCERILRESSAPASVHVAFNPEFLREGSAIFDYDHSPYTVVGTEDPIAEAQLRDLYAMVDAPVLVVGTAVAEMVKYVANAWHATKIVFANEVGRIAKGCGVDGREVMDIITQDHKLNVSGAYMRPGFAYGGSCLPKDVRALTFQAQRNHVAVPLLAALPVSNTVQIDAAVAAVLARRSRRVGILGLAFKTATDDLRESPAVALVKRLIGEGCEVGIFAPDVNKARLMGTNLSYIRENLPHFERLLVDDLDGLMDWSQVLVITHGDSQFGEALAHGAGGRAIIDLAGVFPPAAEIADCDGIGW